MKKYKYPNMRPVLKIMSTGKILLLLLVASAFASHAQSTLLVNAKGEKLKEFYHDMHVEQLWPAGQHVDWETGKPDNPNADHNIKTHCSVFAAAACKRLHIYILRPPEHAQGLLANAQYDWLTTTEAKEKGWRSIEGNKPYQIAQEYANEGYVVVAIYQNADRHRPGHTALVLPAVISAKELDRSGPMIIQAGKRNYDSATLMQGFANHISSWPSTEVMFYYNTKMPF